MRAPGSTAVQQEQKYKSQMKKSRVNENQLEMESENLPEAAIPVAKPTASRKPIMAKSLFGIAIISFVTIPALYLHIRIVK